MQTLLLMAAIVTFNASDRPSDYDRAFERIKSLVGTWDVEGAERQVTYFLTGDNETVVESFTGEPTMSSFYHRDGDDLRLTHYCNAGNQPRMKAVRYDAAKGILEFDFVDVTNLSAPEAYHTRELEIRFLSDDRIVLDFVGMKNGETSSSPMTLIRRSQ